MNDYQISEDRAALQQSVRNGLIFTPRSAAENFDTAQRHMASMQWVIKAQEMATEAARAYRRALGVPDPEETENE